MKMLKYQLRTSIIETIVRAGLGYFPDGLAVIDPSGGSGIGGWVERGNAPHFILCASSSQDASSARACLM